MALGQVVDEETRADLASVAPRIAATAVSVRYPSDRGDVWVLDNVTMTAGDGEFVSIVGASGCGKTTLLNVLSGLVGPDSGSVNVDGRDVTGNLGHAAYMFQHDLLLPWKSVIDNTAIALEIRGVPRPAAREQARALFDRFGLAGFEHRYPDALSGGMRQRAALLRTVLTGRDILLLDEPFGALDALTRADMQAWLIDVWSSFKKTVVLVTHDVEEAIYLSDRVCVMTARPGTVSRVIRVDLPRTGARDEIVTSARFAQFKGEVLSALHGRDSR